ncbi:hypothetical protein M0R45_012620 [Rubus argutus]|uniref:CHD subfamily II SANT-like domain-containing protein n=1 Tax=Rubus argutus TaxID=59490 RepID=A0AAW1YG96_RUBAR
MRFGIGDFDWKEFTPRMKQKTYEEIKDYGIQFMKHIIEDITDSPTFSDGVPKEGLRIPDVLVRIAVLSMIHQKVKFAMENPGASLFEDDILLRYPGLKGSKFWKEDHDLILLRAVLKHGYGRWQAIVDDKDLGIQEVICQELNLPFINLPIPGQVKAQNGAHTANTEAPGNTSGNGNDIGANVSQGTIDPANQPQLYQESSMLHHFRDMQRRLVEFIKRRVLLLEKGHNAEAQKEYYEEMIGNEVPSEEPEKETKVTRMPNPGESDMQMGDQLPRIEEIGSEEILAAACDNNPDRLKLAQLYNEMCKFVEGNAPQSLQNSFETICEDILSSTRPRVQQNPPTSAQPTFNADKQSGDESKSKIVVPESPSAQDGAAAPAAEVQMTGLATEPNPETMELDSPNTADE